MIVAFALGHALLLVGVEQGLRRETFEHEVELPCQVVGVAKAGAQALRQEGRHLVTGVAGQEDAAAAPGCGEQRTKLVVDDANELELVRRGALAAVEAAPDVLGFDRLDGVFAVEQHEGPPAVVRAHAHGHAGLGRLAELAHVGQVGALLTARPRVDDQPGLVEAQVLVLGADRAADEAVAAVRADQVATRKAIVDTGAVGRDRDAVGPLLHVYHGFARVELDVGLGAHEGV